MEGLEGFCLHRSKLFTKYLERMGFGVWLVGAADQPHPKMSFFRRLRRESGRAFHKVSDFVKGQCINLNLLDF
jgi:hypothetical protein